MCNHNTYSYLWLDEKLKAVDQCIAPLILQLNLAGIKTIGSCCGHGKGYPNVICAPGTEEKLRKFGCKIIVTKKNGNVESYFPVNSWAGKVYITKKNKKKESEMNQKTIELGDKVRDTVSGIVGIAVSDIVYLNGCHQYGVQAPFQDGKMPAAEYIDVGQLIVVTKRADIQAEKEDIPGGASSYAPGSRIKSDRMDHLEIGARIGKPMK